MTKRAAARHRIGEMQSLVLDSLLPSKRAYAAHEFDYIGGNRVAMWVTRIDHARAVGARKFVPLPDDLIPAFSQGEHITLGDGVYDLRCALLWAALKTGNAKRNPHREGDYSNVEDKFRISFMRAATILVKDGFLIRLTTTTLNCGSSACATTLSANAGKNSRTPMGTADRAVWWFRMTFINLTPKCQITLKAPSG